MDWNAQDDKKKKGVDAQDVSCDEGYEKDYLVQQIMREYGVSEKDAKAAVEQCCRKVEAPRPRKDFLACVKDRLGK